MSLLLAFIESVMSPRLANPKLANIPKAKHFSNALALG